jgi:hypothetical protein
MSIAQHIKKMAGSQIMLLVPCVVDSVNENNDTIDCTPTDGSAELLDVSLRANIDETHTGFINYPKVGSIVVVGIIEPTAFSAVVLMCSETDKTKLQIGGTTHEWSSESIEMNGGKLGGLVKIQPLLEGLHKNNQILTALLTIINGAPIPEPGSGAPSALQIALKAVLTTAQVGDFSQIENPKIKQ